LDLVFRLEFLFKYNLKIYKDMATITAADVNKLRTATVQDDGLQKSIS
jgi:hypothetical protein